MCVGTAAQIFYEHLTWLTHTRWRRGGWQTDTHTHTHAIKSHILGNYRGSSSRNVWDGVEEAGEEWGELEAAFVMAQVVRAVNLRTLMMMAMIMMKLN